MQEVDELVKSLVKDHGTNDPFLIAAQKNIQIIYEPLGTVFGYFHTYKRIPFIHLNNLLDDYLLRYVCAHELGHAIKHRYVNTPFLKRSTLFSVDKIEREAHEFAVHLLTNGFSPEIGESLSSFLCRHGVPKEMSRYY